jgi:polar amino acid transport system permease protein
LDFLTTAIFILKGTGYTVALVIGALALGFLIGLPLACLRLYGPPIVSRLVAVYVWFFRGVPILVLLFLVYFGFYSVIEKFLLNRFDWRISFSPFSASLVALGLASAAYQSQIFRGAIQSLHLGQFKAALALGFSKTRAIFHIIIPQALRLSLPAWSNEYSILLKDSAIAYVLGTMEIMSRTKAMAAFTYKHISFYVLAGVIYYILTFLGVRLLRYCEKRTHIPGLGTE